MYNRTLYEKYEKGNDCGYWTWICRFAFGATMPKKKYDVIGIVKNPQKAELINKGISPIKDSVLEKQILKYPIYATTDFKKISKVEIIIRLVPK